MIKRLCFILILYCCSVSIAQGQQNTELYRKLHHASHDSVRIRLYTQMAVIYYDKNYIDSSLVFAQNGITLSQKLNLLSYQADLYRLLGLNYRIKKKLNEAISFFLKSRKIAIQLGQNPQIEKAGYALAVAYADIGDYKSCIKNIFENLDFAKKNKSNLRLTSNYLLLTYLNSQYGNDSVAIYYRRKAWEIDTYRQKDKQKSEAANGLILSDSIKIHLKAGKPQLADKLLDEFLKSGNSTRMPLRDYIDVLQFLAQTYATYNYLQKSLDLYEYLIPLARKEPTDMAEFMQHSVYPQITQIYLKQNNLSKAIFWHNKSQMLIDSATFFKHLSTASKKIEILRNEAIILEKKGLYKKALSTLRLQETLKGYLDQKRKEIELLQITVLRELEANQQKVQNLGDQVKIQALINENDKRKNSFLIILIVFLLVLVILTFLFLRQITAKHKLVLAQKAKIEAQSVELEDANQIKDKLFSIIGHDLRSPVADLLAALEIANSLKPMKMKQYIFRMQDKIRFLYDTIDNLLNWSVTNLNPKQAPLKLINFKEAIRETIYLLESNATKKNISIINQVEDTGGYTNEHQLQVILRNILGNAIKFTPQDGFIKIYTIHEEKWVGIAIRDSGMGMEKDTIHTSFESKPGTAGEKGTGLGLRLSRELIEKQGGLMKIKSQPGKGTLVELYFKNSLSPQPVLN